ncbi:MAG: SMP-30/gluconolactonase/LRE family protein [Actinomycetales bacterium]|jgi:sugar lactone lactonase YvrE|nr:SMP-30/gluconolactonase/LRE family protein [Actinomycetales bacterium]
MPDVVVDQVTDPLAYHAEGPVWSAAWGGLRWVDMFAGDLLTLRPDGGVDRLPVGGPIAAFVRPRTNGGYVVGLERGLGLADAPDAPPTPLPPLLGEGERFNEAGCDPQGRLYAGTMRYDRAAGGARLYRFDAAGRAEVVLPAVTISNGIAFSPDGTRAYYNDTLTRTTDVFDVVDGELTGRRPFHRTDHGFPDGLTVDAAGNVWVAMFTGGRVVCLAPDGAVVTEVAIPARLATACAFGGPDLRDLYVTTSREDLDDPEPAAGAVFRLRADVPGLPVLPYAG